MTTAIYDGEIQQKPYLKPYDYEIPDNFTNFDAYDVKPLVAAPQKSAVKYGQAYANDNPLGQTVPGSLFGKRYETSPSVSIDLAPIEEFQPSAIVDATVDKPVEVKVEKQKGSGKQRSPPPSGYVNSSFTGLVGAGLRSHQTSRPPSGYVDTHFSGLLL